MASKNLKQNLTDARKAKEDELTPPANRSLATAKSAKQDEFYTQYLDIQKEIEAYLEFDANAFRSKVVYCNCDDPFETTFSSISPPILTGSV